MDLSVGQEEKTEMENGFDGWIAAKQRILKKNSNCTAFISYENTDVVLSNPNPSFISL